MQLRKSLGFRAQGAPEAPNTKKPSQGGAGGQACAAAREDPGAFGNEPGQKPSVRVGKNSASSKS